MSKKYLLKEAIFSVRAEAIAAWGSRRRWVYSDMPTPRVIRHSEWIPIQPLVACNSGPWHIPKNVKHVTFYVSTRPVEGSQWAYFCSATGPFRDLLHQLRNKRTKIFRNIPDGTPLWWWIEYEEK